MSGLVAAMLSLGRAPRPRIFISYRRHGEGAGYGGRLADKLVERFGSEQVFRDVDDIESGVDFVQAIEDAVGGCEVLLAVIGPDWITQTNQKGRRRLDDPRDFVRLEVAAALERNIRVIPVLVGGAAMPGANELPEVLEPLARRQALELTDTRWDYDVGRLLTTIESAGIKRAAPKRPEFLGKWKLAAGVLCMGTVVGVFQLMPNSSHSGGSSESEKPRVMQPHEPEPANRTADIRESKPEDGSLRQADFRYDNPAPLKPSVRLRTTPKPDVPAPDPRGLISFSWTQGGIVYNAVVTAMGRQGIARVTYADPTFGVIGADQDLTLVQKGNSVFYVGSNPRLPGTFVAHPSYAPDIFELARMPNGTWGVNRVGSGWQQFGVVDSEADAN